MKSWIEDNLIPIRITMITINILMIIHFNFVQIQDALLGIFLISIPLALFYGTFTNLFIPSGSRREYYSNRNNNDYGE